MVTVLRALREPSSISAVLNFGGNLKFGVFAFVEGGDLAFNVDERVLVFVVFGEDWLEVILGVPPPSLFELRELYKIQGIFMFLASGMQQMQIIISLKSNI